MDHTAPPQATLSAELAKEVVRLLRDEQPELLLRPLEVGIEGVARLLGRTPAAVKKLRHEGRLPKPIEERTDCSGRVHEVRWLVEDIRLWIELGKPSPEVFERERRRRGGRS